MHPRDGWELTDVGVSFRWHRQVEPGRRAIWTYRLQVARDPGFGHPEIDRVVDPLAENRRPGDPWADCRQMSYTPPELLPAGAWYWRVRVADGDGGPWSASTRFLVNSDHRAAPILRPIGADRPLAVFDMWNLEARRDISWADYWRTIPADLRPYVAFQVNRFGVGRDPESDFPFHQTMQQLADLRLPCYVGTGGPSKPVSCYSDPAELEWMFQHFPTLDGIVTGETFWAYGPRAAEEARYYNRVLQLCAKYGRHFIQGDGNWGHFNWDRFFAAKPRGATDSPVCDRADPDLLRACGASLVPCSKTNIRDSYFEAASAVMGAWLQDMVTNFGIWHEAWYWSDVHFDDPFLEPTHGGDLRKMPPILWDQALLTGLAAGATVLKFGGESSVTEWGSYDAATDRFDGAFGSTYTGLWDQAGHATMVLDRYVVPFLRAVVQRRLIPSRAEVLREVKVAVAPGPLDADRGVTADFGRYAPLYRATYGLRDYHAFDPDANEPVYKLSLPPGSAGRYVRVQLSGELKCLSLAEVHVVSGGVNAALQASASQSSVDHGGVPGRAVDGNVSGRWESGTITHTREEKDPWWEVDLGGMRPVERVVIYPRQNLEARVVGSRVSLLGAGREEVWHVDTPEPTRNWHPDGAQYELIPNTGRYYFIPVLPGPEPAPPGVTTLPLNELQDEIRVNQRFGGHYLPRAEGDAWVCRVGDRVFVMNSHENRNVTQPYRIPLAADGAIAALAGTALPHWYLLAKRGKDDESLWLQVNANHRGPYTDGRCTELELSCRRQPEVEVRPPGAVVERRWDPSTRLLHLKLSHRDGAVEAEVRASR